MNIKMLLPIFDKWDTDEFNRGVLIVELVRHNNELAWLLKTCDVGRFSSNFLHSICFLDSSANLPVINRTVINRLKVRSDVDLFLPYCDGDIENAISLDEFKASL